MDSKFQNTKAQHSGTIFESNSAERKHKVSSILSVPGAIVFSVLLGALSFWGSSAQPALVPTPGFSSLTVGICIFFLLLPFAVIKRKKWDVLSPQAMGMLGYLIYIGVGAATNHMWPGLAVNPSLFPWLPIGIIAQTLAALAFFGGTQFAKRQPRNCQANRTTSKGRLAVVLLAYAFFTLYVSVFMPRIDSNVLRMQIRAGEQVHWLFSVGPTIILQVTPMILAANLYLREARFLLVRVIVNTAFGLSIVIYLVSGSRVYATQLILLLLVAYIVASNSIKRKLVVGVMIASFLVFIASTAFRLSEFSDVNINPGTTSLPNLVDRALEIYSATKSTDFEGITQNVKENIVYHLSDNQAMAMLISNNGNGLLFGQAFVRSLVSGLPGRLRPSNYTSATGEIMRHFSFVKESATDASYWPDWQMSVGVLGYADFGWIGLVLYPFVMGVLFRWIYNTVLDKEFGEAGWLIYIPIVFVLWNPLLYGPDSSQSLRLLLPLAVGLRWATRRTAANPEDSQPDGLSQC